MHFLKRIWHHYQGVRQAKHENNKLFHRYKKYAKRFGHDFHQMQILRLAFKEIQQEFPFAFPADIAQRAEIELCDKDNTFIQRGKALFELLGERDFTWEAYDKTVQILQQAGRGYPKPYEALATLTKAKDPEVKKRKLKTAILARTIHARAKAIEQFLMRELGDAKDIAKMKPEFRPIPMLRYYGDRFSPEFIDLFVKEGYSTIIKYDILCRMPPLYPGDTVGIEYFKASQVKEWRRE